MNRSGHISTDGLELCAPKSPVRSARLPALRCLTPQGTAQRCEPLISVGSLPLITTHTISTRDSGLSRHAETPKFFRDSNNTNLRCYAPVTHGRRCHLWNRLLKRNLGGFLAQLERSLRLSWLGPHNNGICENPRKTLTSVTPKTPKTPACVTHRLRTPGFMLYIRAEVNGQTSKAGVMRMLCTLFCAVWKSPKSGLTSWQRSG